MMPQAEKVLQLSEPPIYPASPEAPRRHVTFLQTHHQHQYDAETAAFFEDFNNITGRSRVYTAYIAGQFDNHEANKNHIAVDFGCGTGWMTRSLAGHGYKHVYGIDTSQDMLGLAFRNTSSNLINSSKVMYHDSIPDEIKGQCKLVVAAHVHYHFTPENELVSSFFAPIANMLSSDGEAVLIGCPSDYIKDTPPHYYNSVHIDNIPQEVRQRMSSGSFLRDEEGFIPLSCVPGYKIQDGTQMRATLMYSKNGELHKKDLRDTFWSDEKLVEAGKKAGLTMVKKNLLDWDPEYPRAYMMMHFRKAKAIPLAR